MEALQVSNGSTSYRLSPLIGSIPRLDSGESFHSEQGKIRDKSRSTGPQEIGGVVRHNNRGRLPQAGNLAESFTDLPEDNADKALCCES